MSFWLNLQEQGLTDDQLEQLANKFVQRLLLQVAEKTEAKLVDLELQFLEEFWKAGEVEKIISLLKSKYSKEDWNNLLAGEYLYIVGKLDDLNKNGVEK